MLVEHKYLPKITVITVVYNARDDLEVTIDAIINQTYKNIEFIIIDGGSTDGTVDVIKKYSADVTTWISEADKGIYDAMNKGAVLATGDVVNFMNAGDIFATSSTVEEVAGEIIEGKNSLYIGGWQVKYPDGTIKSNILGGINNQNVFYSMPVCHQSIFAPLYFLNKYKFDTNYKIAADFNFFLFCVSENSHMTIFNKELSCVTSGGVSDTMRIKTWNEYQDIHEKHFGINMQERTYYIYRCHVERLKSFIKRLIKLKPCF